MKTPKKQKRLQKHTKEHLYIMHRVIHDTLI